MFWTSNSIEFSSIKSHGPLNNAKGHPAEEKASKVWNLPNKCELISRTNKRQLGFSKRAESRFQAPGSDRKFSRIGHVLKRSSMKRQNRRAINQGIAKYITPQRKGMFSAASLKGGTGYAKAPPKQQQHSSRHGHRTRSSKVV